MFYLGAQGMDKSRDVPHGYDAGEHEDMASIR